MYKFKTIFVFLILSAFAPCDNSFGQTNQRATFFLDELKKPTLKLSNDFLEFTRYELLNGITRRSIREKKSILSEIEKQRIKIAEVQAFNGQEGLKIAYAQYFTSMKACLKEIPEFENQPVENFNVDTAKKNQDVLVNQLDQLLKASAALNSEVQVFCIMNHVVGKKKSGALYERQKEAIKLIKFAGGVKNILMSVRQLNRKFFVSLEDDTGQLAEAIRQELAKVATRAKLEIQAIPNFPGDKTLKRKAWNNVIYYSRSASRTYIDLVRFRDKQLEFRKKSEEYEKRRKVPGYDSKDYYDAIKLFSLEIKKNRKDRLTLDKKRNTLETSFDDNFLDFVKSRFIL